MTTALTPEAALAYLRSLTNGLEAVAVIAPDGTVHGDAGLDDDPRTLGAHDPATGWRALARVAVGQPRAVVEQDLATVASALGATG